MSRLLQWPHYENDFVWGPPSKFLAKKKSAFPVEAEGGEGECCGSDAPTLDIDAAGAGFPVGGSCRGKGAHPNNASTGKCNDWGGGEDKS